MVGSLAEVGERREVPQFGQQGEDCEVLTVIVVENSPSAIGNYC